MTTEQINIAIAKACELFRLAPLKRTTRKGKDDPDGVVLWYCSEDHGGAKTYDKVPNYCNDLNAMHEAEEILADIQWPEYRDELRTVILGPVRIVSDWCKADLHATARQRAEALLRAIGKWEGGGM